MYVQGYFSLLFPQVMSELLQSFTEDSIFLLESWCSSSLMAELEIS